MSIQKHMALSLGTAILLGMQISPPVSAAATQWNGNGHYYALITANAGITWGAASLAAASLGGYLATITSAAENTFVASLANANPQAWVVDNFFGNIGGPWLGGFQPNGSSEPAGGWQWVNGEGGFTYTNWAINEPNNYPGPGNTESLLSFMGKGVTNLNTMVTTWNDGSSSGLLKGYIVESLSPFTVPEPSTLLLMFSGLALPLARTRRKNNLR